MPQGHPGMGGGARRHGRGRWPEMGGGTMPGGNMPGGNMPGGNMPGGMGSGPAGGTKLALDDQHVSGVAKVAGGYQVGEIYAKGAELGGKSVKVRGRVVKFTPNIMGTNWIHIQDGSGEGATVDLTVTTSEIVAVGDVIVAEGVLAIDKDVGAGYVYAAIIEKAAVTMNSGLLAPFLGSGERRILAVLALRAADCPEFFISPDATHMPKSRYSFVTAEQP
ncbi:MAG: hypothetical protein IPG61_20275 [bacterium]|nr:hypothetical protein [bacterium]